MTPFPVAQAPAVKQAFRVRLGEHVCFASPDGPERPAGHPV